MGLGAAAEIMTLDSTGEAFTFAHTNHIDAFANFKLADIDLIAFFYFRCAGAEFTQIFQWRQFHTFQMPQLASRKFLFFNFTKTDLNG